MPQPIKKHLIVPTYRKLALSDRACGKPHRTDAELIAHYASKFRIAGTNGSQRERNALAKKGYVQGWNGEGAGGRRGLRP